MLCSYQTRNKTDWKRVKRQKHLAHVLTEEKTNVPGQDNRVAVLKEFLKKKYPQVEGEDYTDLDFLTAMAFLAALHRRTGRQAMSRTPLRLLFETVHKFQYHDAYFMRASRNKILSKTLNNHEYSFKVFSKFYETCREVVQYANEMIKDRMRATRYEHNRRNWECYNSCVENCNFPMFLKDKTPKQKDYECISLHEYFQTCG